MKTRLIRFATASYALLLTYLLASESAPGMVSSWMQVSVWLMYIGAIVHLQSHTVLAVLCMGSKLPWNRAMQIGMLVAYAVGMELLHLALEKRSFEWIDMAQNLLGLALGLGIVSMVGFWRSRQQGPMVQLSNLDLMARVQRTDNDLP